MNGVSTQRAHSASARLYSYLMCVGLLCLFAAVSQPTAAGLQSSSQTPATSSTTVAAVSLPQNNGPVSYASMTQLNTMLAQLESTSKTTQTDLAKMRIERWKADGNTKKQALSQEDSIQRNLQGALPEMIAQLRAAPEDLPATFKLFRNLDALYDVMSNVVESAGAFGSKDDFQALSNDLNTFEATRRAMADRVDTLSTAKEAEIVRLRTDLKAAREAIPATPPKKVVVDDNEPAKKPGPRKKPPVKSAAPASAAQPGQAGPSSTQQTPAKPQ